MRINREEFNELLEKQRSAKKATGFSAEKEKLRLELEAEVAKFLKQGGKVVELNPGESGFVVRGNKRAGKSGSMTRNSTTSVRGKSATYEGYMCWNCNSTTRYLSNRKCVNCATKREKSQQVTA